MKHPEHVAQQNTDVIQRELEYKQISLCLTVKKLNTPEYRHYLKLWNQETKPKRENTKDLPKLNQVGDLCV